MVVSLIVCVCPFVCPSPRFFHPLELKITASTHSVGHSPLLFYPQSSLPFISCGNVNTFKCTNNLSFSLAKLAN